MIEKMMLKIGGAKEDAADIFQNALLVFLDMVEEGRFKEEASIKTLLYAISRNLWLKEQRSKVRKSRAFVEWSADQDRWEVAMKDSMSGLKVSQLLERIDDGCQKLLNDYYYSGLSYDDIAQRYGMGNRDSVKVKKFRCLRKLVALVKRENLGIDSFILD